MADHKEVIQGIKKRSDVTFTALTPNLKGFQSAVSSSFHMLDTQLHTLLDNICLTLKIIEYSIQNDFPNCPVHEIFYGKMGLNKEI